MFLVRQALKNVGPAAKIHFQSNVYQAIDVARKVRRYGYDAFLDMHIGKYGQGRFQRVSEVDRVLENRLKKDGVSDEVATACGVVITRYRMSQSFTHSRNQNSANSFAQAAKELVNLESHKREIDEIAPSLRQHVHTVLNFQDQELRRAKEC